ncbi:MAG: subclass B1 metallo-beta-lactamase [Calditrichaeota bacterium]|nr:subclass B1 metallo-beta-lactamase [Calditrichota bacterium]
MRQIKFFFISLIILACNNVSIDYKSDDLSIRQIAENTFIHTSYFDSETFGKVPCNGMIVVNQGEAIVFDTPTTDSVSVRLIDWLENKMNSRVIAVVPTHFHLDCLGGLQTLHKRGIKSYASKRTIELAKANNYTIPLNAFDKSLTLKAGTTEIESFFPGEGHTRDNIVAFVSGDDVLFGGCLVKSLGASKGNLEDANVASWSQSVEMIKSHFPEIKIVIPGHGEHGSIELLNYTIKTFIADKK